MRKGVINRVNRLVEKSIWYNEVAFKDCRKFWDLKDNDFKVVNLGSTSGVFDFDYSSLSVKGMNWAVAPQTMIGDFAVLRQYHGHLSKEATIIYPFCPFTSISGAAEYVEDRCYSFLDFDLIPNAHYIRLTKVKQMKESPWLFYPVSGIKADLKRCLFRSGGPHPLMDDKSLDKDAQVFLNSWKKQFSIEDLSKPFTGKNKLLYDKGVLLLKEISSYCKTNGFKLVIVIPPMHHSLASLFSHKDRTNLIDNFIKEGIDETVSYYNMMDDERYSHDNTLFLNSYYLNPHGAKKYTEALIKMIL